MRVKLGSQTGRRLRGGALAALILLAATLPAKAREIDSFTIRLDNDTVAGTDANYTAGTEFDFAYKSWSKQNDSATYHRTLALGQWIFTPQDLEESEVIENDRPYAGWSYLRYGQHRTDGKALTSWQLTLGLVGPSSFAEDLQSGLHELIDSEMPQGWKNQLSDEFGYALEHSRQATRLHLELGNERSLQVSESTRVALGNLDTSLRQGFQIRVGKNLRMTPLSDRLGSPASEVYRKEPYVNLPQDLQPIRFYWILGGSASYVAHNLFLDGNGNAKSHSVERKPWVQELETGFAFSTPGMKLSFLIVHRTEEFEEQDSGQTFGSFSFTFRR